eukprot:NODE_211_length_12764_cov_0.923727.p4 type:complete len:268 gc:universal NODE_211_length_12764_cov_0.923727:2230-3033(+)
MTNGNHPRKLQSLMIKHKRKALLQLVQGSISIKKLAKENKVDPKTIRDWRKNADKIFTYRGRNSRKMVLIGHSMKFGSIEDIIIERIKFLMLCKSSISYDRIYKWIEKQDFEAFNDGTFKASRNWYDGMLKRNNLVPRAATQLVKKDDQYLIESVAKHILQVKSKLSIKVPAGTKGYCQLADVGLIKSFEAGIRKSILDFYDEQVDEFQANPNKPKVFQKPGIVKLRDWIVCEWAKVTPEITERTLKTCYLSENVEELHMAKLFYIT